MSQKRIITPNVIGHNITATLLAETFGSSGIAIWRMAATNKTRNYIVSKTYNCFINNFLFGFISIFFPLINNTHTKIIKKAIK